MTIFVHTLTKIIREFCSYKELIDKAYGIMKERRMNERQA